MVKRKKSSRKKHDNILETLKVIAYLLIALTSILVLMGVFLGWFDISFLVLQPNTTTTTGSGSGGGNYQSTTTIAGTTTTTTTLPQYDNGEIVGGGSNDVNMNEGVNGVYYPIDLTGVPPYQEGGNCKLKARIQTNWAYLNDGCVGIQASEGMEFSLTDSTGAVVWDRVDYSPLAVGTETACGLYWDGETAWQFSAEKILKMYTCWIGLEYRVDVITCECE